MQSPCGGRAPRAPGCVACRRLHVGRRSRAADGQAVAGGVGAALLLELERAGHQDDVEVAAPGACGVVGDPGQARHRLVRHRAQGEQVEVRGGVDELLGGAGAAHEAPPQHEPDRTDDEDRHERRRHGQQQRDPLDGRDEFGSAIRGSCRFFFARRIAHAPY